MLQTTLCLIKYGWKFDSIDVHNPHIMLVAQRHASAYYIDMSRATPIQPGEPEATDWKNQAFDLTRGIAVYSNSKLVAGLARVIAKHPHAEVGVAFNHKQLASKIWARDSLLTSLGGKFQRVWILGGWYGVLAAMLLDDPRFEIETIDSIDIDPAVEDVGRTLMGDVGDRFRALTNDMYALDYAAGGPDLVINTSCEHIIDLKTWLQLLPRSTAVLLQSNNYFSEPTHINCMNSLAEFTDEAGLTELVFSGELQMKNYTRFMLIGRV